MGAIPFTALVVRAHGNRMSIHDRGFASMSPAKRAALSSKGGLKAHKLGHAYEWTERTASKAGRLGGIASGLSRRRKRAAAQKAADPAD